MVDRMDVISKQRLNVILLVDTSKSMGGERIKQVDGAIKEIKDYLTGLEFENTNVDFYMSIISFATDSKFYENQKFIKVDDLDYKGLTTGGWSNLDTGYSKLSEILKKESKGGSMPDFGGVAPIILLLTDGHPTSDKYKDELAKLETCPWFKVALRYGIAIELDDQRTFNVLKDFTGNNGDVVKCVDATILKTIIKIIVLTASKVKSQSSNVTKNPVNNKPGSTSNPMVNFIIKQDIADALNDIDGVEW